MKRQVYFDVDSLISAQVSYFDAQRPVLKKYADINGSKDTTVFTPSDSIAWSQELAIFRQLDMINKPTNKGRYTMQDGINDPNSNLTICKYSATTDLPLQHLTIYYQDKISKVRRMEAVYTEKNALFINRRSLSFQMQEVYNNTVLTSYSIEGEQKMILGDTVRFKIAGLVIHPQR